MPAPNSACVRHREDPENPGLCFFCKQKLDDKGRDAKQAALHDLADALDQTTFVTNDQLLEEARQRVVVAQQGAIRRGKQALKKLREEAQ